jgi:hypothetical protein
MRGEIEQEGIYNVWSLLYSYTEAKAKIDKSFLGVLVRCVRATLGS